MHPNHTKKGVEVVLQCSWWKEMCDCWYVLANRKWWTSFDTTSGCIRFEAGVCNFSVFRGWYQSFGSEHWSWIARYVGKIGWEIRIRFFWCANFCFVVGNNVSGVAAISQPWPGISRTIFGNHRRYLSTYMVLSAIFFAFSKISFHLLFLACLQRVLLHWRWCYKR